MKKYQIFLCKIRARLLPFIIHIHWELARRRKGFYGITKDKRNEKIIVSLTSFPGRIFTVERTIWSLMLQRYKPDEIVLWLNPEQFERGRADIPDTLIRLERFGLKIGWYHNIRSYTKLIPALKEYPDDVIVTADDDIYYYSKWLKRLVEAYRNDKTLVYAHRVTQFQVNKSGYHTVVGGIRHFDQPSYLHKLTGVGGVLYPPHIFPQEVFCEEKFRQLAPTNDDIWFWLMLVLNHIRVAIPQKNNPILSYVGHTQEGECLNKINDNGEHLFWKDFERMLEYYSDLDRQLRKEQFLMDQAMLGG